MKRFLIFTTVLFFSSINLCHAEQTPVVTAIKKVVVFVNQALISREGELSVPAGLNHLAIETTASSIDENSVSAKIFGEGEIYSVQYKRQHLLESPEEKIQELQKKLEVISDEITSLDNKKTMLKQKKTFINSIANLSNITVPSDFKIQIPSIGSLTELLAFIESSLDDVHTQELIVEKSIRDLKKKQTALKNEFDDVNGYRSKDKKIIEIVFLSKKQQIIRIETAYLVNRAYWQPLYKIDVPLNLQTANLTMFAKIKQSTGEDWQNVTLSVSNVTPMQGASLPKLTRWDVDIFKKPRYQPKRKIAEIAAYSPRNQDWDGKAEDTLLGGNFFAAADAVKEKEAEITTATATELPLAFEYKMPQKLNIESKNDDTMLPVFQKELKGDVYYYAVPKLNNSTFLVCKTKATSELISGTLNVHFDKRFVGSSYLEEKRPGEAFNIVLGADREVKIKREKTLDKRKETSFFGKLDSDLIVKDMSFKLTVENLKKEKVRLHLFDNIPIAKTDKIKISDVDISLEPTARNYLKKEGLLFWDLELKPHTKKEITISFAITYPKEAIISGIRN